MGTENTLSAKQAVQVAEQYVKDTIEVMNAGRSNPEFAVFIDEFRTAVTTGSPEAFERGKLLLTQLAALGGNQLADLCSVSVVTAEAARLWRRHRVVYRVHPGLADSLIETDTRTSVPCSVFARLPHPDPFVVFPTPIPAPMVVDGPVRVIAPPVFVGMLVTGMTKYESVCSTADPDLDQLVVALASRIQYEGGHPTHDESTVMVPVSGTYSVDALIQRAEPYGGLGTLATDGKRHVHNLALSLLLYLCSDRRDARDYAPDPGRRHRKQRHRKESRTIVDLGFDIGPALHAARRQADDDGDGTRGQAGEKRVRAHLRRAHWHTYWTGPREAKTPEVRWLHPILVHKHDYQSRPTVVEVAEPDTPQK